MFRKYKISEIAKDLNISSKEIINELKKFVSTPLKTTSSLNEEQSNIILEIYSKKNEVKNFEDYFAKAAAKKSVVKKNEPKTKSDVDSVNRNKVIKKKDSTQKKLIIESKLEEASVNVTAEKSEKRIETKSVQVNFDKYNERYESLAQEARETKGRVGSKSRQKVKKRGNLKIQKPKETEFQKQQRIALEKARKLKLKVSIPNEIVVSELASRLKINVAELIKKLVTLGVMVTVNDVVDFDVAAVVAEELGAEVEKEVNLTIEERLFEEETETGEQIKRNPVVVVMGHVDHGKTSLLDKIRNSNVISSEAGGITQHIGASCVKTENGGGITFLDTPGHEAFTSMRMRGANVTDVAILVVAADDGVKPQTIEAINHAKVAGIPIIVAVNKIDKPEANPDVVKQQLIEHELVPEEWGGDAICVNVSAKTGEGISQLLKMVELVADLKELKSTVNCSAKGVVIEAFLDKGRGPAATLLVQSGTLKEGDSIIVGDTVGRVRQMRNDRGERIKNAGPSIPVEITGLSEVPQAGDLFNVVFNEKLAKELAKKRKFMEKQEQFSANKVKLDNLFSQIEQSALKEIAIIVKADVSGSVEAVKSSFEKLSNEEVRVKVIHGAVGAINKSDIMLASASNAIVIGFNVRPDAVSKHEAEENGIEIKTYSVIYDAIEDLKKAMEGMLEPKTKVNELGSAEVREIYRISNVGTIAGCFVVSGKIMKKSLARLVRDGVVIAQQDVVKSLKRFKDDVKEVEKGFECGIGFEKFNDLKVGDVVETFEIEEIKN